MPIALSATMCLINYFGRNHVWNCKLQRSGLKGYSIAFTVLLAIYYGIEYVYFGIAKNMLNYWPWQKGFDAADMDCMTWGCFFLLSIVFIALCVTINICRWDEISSVPYGHVITLIICFTLFASVQLSSLQYDVDEQVFNSMAYETTSETIYLQKMTDTHNTEGYVKGRSSLWSGYINGEIKDNYNIWYSYLGEDGSLVFDFLTYHQNTTKVWPEENCTPRIVKYTHTKSYQTKHNDFSHTYQTYEIFVPSTPVEVELDMQ